MRDPAWLNELHQQLAKKRLPPAYVARLVDELSDHVTDLLEDQMSTDALQSRNVFERLGAPQDIAQQAGKEFRRRSFLGRHPILTFVLLPIVALLASLAVELASFVAVGSVLKSLGPELSSERFSPWAVGGMRLLCTLAVVLPALLMAALFAWLAARTGVNRKWPVITAVILGLLAGASQLDMQLAPGEGQSKLMLGMGLSTAFAATFFQLSKFAVPLGIGLWVFSRRLRANSRALAA